MNTQEVKGTLAKLLATENLTVEHRTVSTACFDVEKRLLILPIWKTATNTIYDLLVGHEVGHALYTPNEDYTGASKAFVNVIEDARIERRMKQTYPGLRKSFFEGYRELWDMDFFGVKTEDISKLALIDRINLYFKGNASIPFADDEQVWVRRTLETKTFKDVVTLAKEMYAYCESKQENKEQVMMPSSKDGQSQADRQEEINESDGDMTHEEMLEEAARRESENMDSDLQTPSYFDGRDIDETKSITDAALQEALETLVDDNAKDWVYINIPTIDSTKYIVPFNIIQNDLDGHFNKTDDGSDTHQFYLKNLQYATDHFIKFKKTTQKTVAYLCKQFEMKKSADEYRRCGISNTGVLDTNKLFKYKLTDDIFKKTTTVPEGKNHGLIMHLDWSGSMQHQLLDTLKQTYNLIWFCQKTGIPFRVYAFQSGYGYSNLEKKPNDQGDGDLAIAHDFRLFELFSSRQNKNSLEKSMRLIYTQVFSMTNYRIEACSTYGLGGTPLAEAIYCTRDIVARMKSVENVTKVNVICLTDGEANPLSYVYRVPDDMIFHAGEIKYSYLCHSRNKLFHLRDPKTGYTRRISNHPSETTREIVSFYREITNYNWIGIRICNKNDLTRIVREFAYDQFDVINKQWHKERFASIKERVGFTEAFFMPDKGIGNDSQEFEVKTKREIASKTELTRAFKKHMGSKMTNKTILNAFIEQIA
jgi:hypothetical protein